MSTRGAPAVLTRLLAVAAGAGGFVAVRLLVRRGNTRVLRVRP